MSCAEVPPRSFVRPRRHSLFLRLCTPELLPGFLMIAIMFRRQAEERLHTVKGSRKRLLVEKSPPCCSFRSNFPRFPHPV